MYSSSIYYHVQVMDIARLNNLSRIQRCCTIMGRKDSDEMSAAQIFYPCMQVDDDDDDDELLSHGYSIIYAFSALMIVMMMMNYLVIDLDSDDDDDELLCH